MKKMLAVALGMFALSIVSSGCLLETTLDAKGGGVMTVTYRAKKDVKLEQEKKRMESAAVKVTSAETVGDSGQVRFKLAFADVTKLPTAPFFQGATVTRSDGSKKGTKVVTAKIVHPKPTKIGEAGVQYFGNEVKFVVTFPGEIVESNAKTKEGKTATWVYGMSEFHEMPEVLLTATYKEAPVEVKAKEPAAKGHS